MTNTNLGVAEDTINVLRGLVYQYCLEERSDFVGGQKMTYSQLNKPNFEKLSGFINWLEFNHLDGPPKIVNPKETI